MSGPDWKVRFSEKQLERKRLSDKISQRRLRQQSKRIGAELECRLQLLTDGQTATLINQMQQENALLRAKIWRYRFQMESIFLKGKDCMLQDDASWSDINAAILTQPPPQQDLHQREETSCTTPQIEAETWWSHLVEQRCLTRIIKRAAPSLFRELGSLLGCTSGTHSQLATNEILESIMMWKAKFGPESSDEFAVLLASQGLGAEPYNLTLAQVKEQALSKHLFHDILQNILYGEELCPRHLQPKDTIPEEQMSRIQYQRRAIAYCVYEGIRAWRDCFKSSLEYLVVFWAHYKYFMVIAFPTLENFDKCPAWRRPIREQFNYDHPLLVDLILWPRIREKLVSTWQQYELSGLCISIARSLEYRGAQTDAAAVIKLQSDSSDLILEESFERALHDIRNFTPTATPSHFPARYPELASSITSIDLELPLAVSNPEQDESDSQASIQSEKQKQTAGSPDYTLAAHSLKLLSHPHQLDPVVDLAYIPDIEAPDLVTDCSSAASDLLHCWTETFANQPLEEFSMELGQKWDPVGFFPDVRSLADTGPVEILEDWQRHFLDQEHSTFSTLPYQQTQECTFHE